MPITPFREKTILLGVSGSIAAYKAADLASKLAQGGARVHAILTKAATQFISPLTFQSVSGQPAYTDADLWGAQAHVLHIGLAQDADLFIIAPATANTLAKLAHGFADDLLALTALALEHGDDASPLLIAPAMDAGMYSHPSTQANIATLRARGAQFVGPETGHLASGLTARGRMSEPATILGRARRLLARGGPLSGRHVVVTAGPTQEPLDPVRYLTNRSSGRQGYALAQAALDSGAEVTLISGPTTLAPPEGARLLSVRSADEMSAAVLEHAPAADVLLMAAAVADFRPAQTANQKIKKTGQAFTLELTATPDILNTLKRQAKRPRVTVGFAAETQDLLTNARAKLEAKGLDLIVANNVSAADAGFAVATNRVAILHRDGQIEELPLMSKAEVATEIIKRIIAMLENPT